MDDNAIEDDATEALKITELMKLGRYKSEQDAVRSAIELALYFHHRDEEKCSSLMLYDWETQKYSEIKWPLFGHIN